MALKNLLFDLGGVIMDIKRENCVDALQKIGISSADELLGLYAQKGAFMLLEEGKISPSEFRDELRKEADRSLSDEQIDEAFNKFLIGIPVERLRALEKLKGEYKIYMLSNTNPIMFNSFIKTEFEKDGKDWDYYFDGICVSYEELCCKPDRKIFLNLLDKFGIKAEETLFFDDSQKNIDAAAELGFQTQLIPPGTEFYQIIKG